MSSFFGKRDGVKDVNKGLDDGEEGAVKVRKLLSGGKKSVSVAVEGEKESASVSVADREGEVVEDIGVGGKGEFVDCCLSCLCLYFFGFLFYSRW